MKPFLGVLALLTAAPCLAGTDFGTEAEAKGMAEALVAIIDAEGLDAARTAMFQSDRAFRLSPMGINLFQGSVLIADNREPETVSADYAKIIDLNGENAWALIEQAAAGPGDALLRWYHYDTQDEYLYHCYSLRAHRDEALVMVCR